KIDFWQANSETKKGDILVMYETSPVSAITSLWRARMDGVVDPFFHYYSHTFITNEIQIPHITLRELKSDKYFSHHPLVRKSFQGVNGWQMNSEDYSELLKIIGTKGGDIQKLPQLYKPNFKKNLSITCEKDVEEKILEPFFHELGVSQNNYIRQMPIHAGRGSRIYPDYALFYDDTPGYEKAKVLIEAKYLMKNNQEIEECFKQARSYANILESSIIVICDMYCMMIYEKGEGFDRNNYYKYYWDEMENPDKFKEVKHKILVN
ncbi:MAG: type I restriction enzyme HsdR N-terminal domain-containing protein, partial [Bacteroidales bacterium]|nr:type I restriction enzyme HsdR N-terminal domain-containing protein [Bacteroidales bacterium]